MTKPGARTSKSEHERERSSQAPVSSTNLAPVPRATRRSEPPSLAEEASQLGHDEREAQLLTQFFSWPPPPSAPFVPPHFERAPLTRESRRAMWASIVMLLGSVSAIGGFVAYQYLVMPQPAELGEWSNSDSLDLEAPGLAQGAAGASAPAGPAARNVYSASLQEPGAVPQGGGEPVAAELTGAVPNADTDGITQPPAAAAPLDQGAAAVTGLHGAQGGPESSLKPAPQAAAAHQTPVPARVADSSVSAATNPAAEAATPATPQTAPSAAVPPPAAPVPAQAAARQPPPSAAAAPAQIEPADPPKASPPTAAPPASPPATQQATPTQALPASAAPPATQQATPTQALPASAAPPASPPATQQVAPTAEPHAAHP